MKKLYLFYFFIAFILLFSVNSCKKEKKDSTPLPGKIADTHVSPKEINTWFDKMPQVKPVATLLAAAQQSVINGVQVVRIPVGYNAAIYFTKENDSLKVYAYKWMYQNLDAEKYTGNIDIYNFQNQNLTRETYADGKLTITLPLAHYTKQISAISSDGKSTSTFCIFDIFALIWEWITNQTGGSGGSSGSGGYNYSFDSYMYSYGVNPNDYSGYGFTTGGGGGGGTSWGPPPCRPTTQMNASINLKVNVAPGTDPNNPGYGGGGGNTPGCVIVNNGQWSPYLFSLFSNDPAIDDPDFTMSNYFNTNNINYNLTDVPELPLYTDNSSDDYVGYTFDPNVDADFIDVKFDPTFSSNTQVNSIYNTLKTQHILQKMLYRFFGKHNPVNLEFRVANLSDPKELAETRPIGVSTNPYTDRIVIVIDGTKAATRPDLMVAKTIIHEVIHAQMFRYIKLDQLGILPSEYHKILTAMATYLQRFPKANPKFNIQDWDHGYMVQHYKTTIAVALKEFDNNPNVPLCFYKMLAWEGLEITPYWSKLNSARQTAINAAISNYVNNQTISPCVN